MDQAGFHSIEMWGGATFDVMTRFLAEDPWERIRALKRLMPKTPFQMLLRGQNLVGYRNYADDVVEAFVHHAAEVGIDIFRIFDAVNDPWNLEASTKAVKAAGKHAQLAISYSVTEGRLGGDIYNLDYYIRKAMQYQDLGADSICIKDMAGLINPMDAETLVKALKPKLRVPSSCTRTTRAAWPRWPCSRPPTPASTRSTALWRRWRYVRRSPPSSPSS